MPAYKDMKKDQLIVVIGKLETANTSLVEEFKAQGIVLVAANEALDTSQAEMKEAKAAVIAFNDELQEALKRIIELEALVPAAAIPVVEEERIMMVCLTDQKFDEFDKPSRFGYTATPNENNDLIVNVPVSRVEAELSRPGERLLTWDEYLEHIKGLHAIYVNLDEDLELEDELK